MVISVTLRNIALQIVTVGKFDKNTVCAYCENDMISINKNKRFCSDKCRIYSRRENVKLINKKNKKEEEDNLLQKKIKNVTELPKNTNELSFFEKRRKLKLGI